MSLATRCTACGTVFRVVQDQLKVSEGWVRCGRCSEVFNALEGLFDLERDLPGDPANALPAASPADAVEPPPANDVDHRHEPDNTPSRSAEIDSSDAIEKLDAQLMHSAESRFDSTPARRVRQRDRLEFPDAQFDSDMLADDPAAVQPVETEPLVSTEPRTTEAPDESATPQFLEQARRKSELDSPLRRATRATAVVALVLVLGWQVVHHHRDVIAARSPWMRETLSAWCGLVGCRIETPLRIDDVVVESTALARASSPDAFTLSVVLRNRGEMPVTPPSVDLSLTDANGQLLSRRMFAASEFGKAAAPIAPGAESALQLSFATGAARVTGYTVEVFYP